MSRSSCLVASGRAAIVGLLIAVTLLWLPQAAQAQPQDAQIRAHLAAGEFAPALAITRDLDDPQARDAWLGQIAAAQAGSGARNPALRTAAEIYDDRARSQTLSGISSQPFGGRGGGAQADFESLIELIQSTIAPETWDEVGGPGSVREFPAGVYVDALGVLRPAMKQAAGGTLAALYAAGKTVGRGGNARARSPLRMISLPRLEKYVQLRLAAGRRPTETMRVLAGLQRIKYVFVYPATGDLVLAGPAGDWTTDAEQRIVSTDTDRPVVRLDDLVVVLRHVTQAADPRFDCNITPRQEALARTQAFLTQSGKRSLASGSAARRAWLGRLRSMLGKQDITVGGIDPRTRAAHVMVEADYRMKLVGMGLEEGVPGVESYLDSLQLGPGEAAPPMGVLRWWFTLNYDAVLASQDLSAFEIRGQGVKVLSENELLTAQGKRVHTGKSEQLNRRFTRSFTEYFDALCNKYHVYAELRNIFDLALAGALIREQDLAGKIGWHMTCFGDPGAYQVQLGPEPKLVETVINHRVIRPGQFIAGVSGGVAVNSAPLATRGAVEIDRRGYLRDQWLSAEPADLQPGAWWWD